MDTTAELLTKIRALGKIWHGSGTVPDFVLDRLAEFLETLCPKVSVETGTGRTTLLFSHLSANHTVFCVDDRGQFNSYGAVQESELLDSGNTKFVIGPTQSTLKNYVFTEPIDFAFLDGPHAYPFLELEYYFIYPHLRTNALLVLDDIHIPTVFRTFEFLKVDKMFSLKEVVGNTAMFSRTDEPVFPPLEDNWFLQEFNKKKAPVRWRTRYWRWRFRHLFQSDTAR